MTNRLGIYFGKDIKMKSLQKAGGVAALIDALTFIVAIALLVIVFLPAGYGDLAVDPLQNVEFLVANQAILYLWNFVAYVIFGTFLVVVALALYARLQEGAPALAQVATAFGLIWAGLMFASGMVANIGASVVADVFGRDPAQAGSVWLALTLVVDGLGGGNEIVGGLWVLLVSWAGLRSGALPRALNIFGLVVSAAGIVTLVPALTDVGAIFGLGSIVWFIWVGIVLLRSAPEAAIEKAGTPVVKAGTAA